MARTKSLDPTRSQLVHVRMTQDEAEGLRTLAAAYSTSVGAMIRRAIAMQRNGNWYHHSYHKNGKIEGAPLREIAALVDGTATLEQSYIVGVWVEEQQNGSTHNG